MLPADANISVEDEIYAEDGNKDGHGARQQLQSASHRVRE